jgi:hypothetical protein
MGARSAGEDPALDPRAEADAVGDEAAVATPEPEPEDAAPPAAAPAPEPPDADAVMRGETLAPAHADRPPPRRAKVATTLTVIGVALFAFVTGLFAFNNMIMPRLIHSTGEVAVPDLVNQTYEQAEQTLRPLNLTLSRAGERFDPNVPRGFVLSQDPAPDTPVRGKKRVMVVVSLGEEFSSVPSLFGESLRSARFLLQRSGLRVSGITRAPSQDVGEGMIAGTDPPAETVLPRNATVSLLISTGSGPEAYVMPDLLGREVTNARRQLESFGFRVLTPPSASVGPIVYQDPPAGSRITLDAEISLQAMGRLIR